MIKDVSFEIARFTVHDTPVVAPLLAVVARLFLKVTGWQRVGEKPPCSKCVYIGAPHTSYWDAVLGLAIVFSARLRIFWMAKHTVFRWPFRSVLKWLGGVPIDRRGRFDIVSQCIHHFEVNERFMLAILPEGTRKRVETWKSGFYHIARGANVPVKLAFLDYPSKTGGFGPMIDLTGNVDGDLARINAFFSTKTGKHPKRSGPAKLSITERRAD